MTAAQVDFAAPVSTIRDGESGVILLQDGGVLTGQITRAADWYVVGRAGGQIQVAADRVLFVGHSLHEAYEYHRKSLSGDSVEMHLALAGWCLRHDLLSDAGNELNAARKLGPNHPKLALLDRWLTSAKERPDPTPPSTSQPPPPTSVRAQTPPPSVTPDLPDGVLELFTRRVQPVLVNNCTVSKCHQPGGPQSFQLNRAILRGEANHRTTMQNLAAALTLVDRERPEASPLLTIPRRTHGGMTDPIFGPRQEQAFKHLADWVTLLAPAKPAAEPVPDMPKEQVVSALVVGKRSLGKAAGATPRSLIPQTSASRVLSPTTEVNAPKTTGTQKPIEDLAVQPAAATDVPQIKTLRTPHRLKFGAAVEKWQPRDAFDPEIFNRSQHPPAQPQLTKSSGN